MFPKGLEDTPFTACLPIFLLQSGGDTSDVLQFVELNFWSNDQCNTAFEVTDYYIDPIAEICAYDEVYKCF